MQDGVGRGRHDPLTFEIADRDVRPPVDDGQQKGVSDRDRKLVAHGGRALGISMEQVVGHG